MTDLPDGYEERMREIFEEQISKYEDRISVLERQVYGLTRWIGNLEDGLKPNE